MLKKLKTKLIPTSYIMHEVLSCVKDWIDSGDGVYVDYSTARIGVM